ncbi:hypothetical protein EWM64_g10834 [Hericium alpestre]|uniref:Dipeptidase n=1 Tax=Hericium alpestre TaxID=135208 RepID=A0A4Y9ZHC9_9AGAM|nr:hypothetical protein EWM64_g10834 [Hericium alpestre]
MDPESATERAPLLEHETDRASKPRKVVQGTLFVIFALGLILFLFYYEGVQYGRAAGEDTRWPWGGDGLPKEPHEAALRILAKAPVIDTHIDLPWLIRDEYSNNASAVDLRTPTPGHVDIPRLRAGKVGGFFWSVYAPCPGGLEGPDFLNPTFSVRDTLEQIDISHELIRKHADVRGHYPESKSI